MKYKLEKAFDGIKVDVDATGTERENVLNAFRACQSGRCQCPTDEYRKLDSLCIEQSEDGISLNLKAKPGQELNPDEIDRCLLFTTAMADQES